MAVQTPDANSRFDNVVGNIRQVTARFASVANNDTWATGLGTITSLSMDSGTSSAIGATTSGGTVTFVTGGTVTGVQAQIQGF